jgi:hypothetical protein
MNDKIHERLKRIHEDRLERENQKREDMQKRREERLANSKDHRVKRETNKETSTQIIRQTSNRVEDKNREEQPLNQPEEQGCYAPIRPRRAPVFFIPQPESNKSEVKTPLIHKKKKTFNSWKALLF